MKTPIFAPLMGLVLILGALASPATASNQAEDPETSTAAASEPEAQPTPIEAGNIEAAEAPAAAEGEEAGRPELPAIDEEADLQTIREDQSNRENQSTRKDQEVSAGTLALLRALETRHASVTTVRGEFDQLKVSEIFLEEIRSEGTFWFKKPDLFRCDYEPPDEMTNLIREDAIYVYVPELEQCEIYRFTSDQERDQQLHSMVLGFGFKTTELVDAYQIESSEDPGALRDELTRNGQTVEETGLLELIPRPAQADTSPFTRLKLWIDKGQLLPEKVWFEDYNGDQTTLEIRTIELNATVDPELFVPSFPRGTEYIDKTES